MKDFLIYLEENSSDWDLFAWNESVKNLNGFGDLLNTVNSAENWDELKEDEYAEIRELYHKLNGI